MTLSTLKTYFSAYNCNLFYSSSSLASLFAFLHHISLFLAHCFIRISIISQYLYLFVFYLFQTLTICYYPSNVCFSLFACFILYLTMPIRLFFYLSFSLYRVVVCFSIFPFTLSEGCSFFNLSF